MKKTAMLLCAGALIFGGVAEGSSVVIGDDGYVASFVKNADMGVARPLKQKLNTPLMGGDNAFVPAGAKFVVQAAEGIDPRLLKQGDTVRFTLTEDFLVNGSMFMKEGHEIVGTVKNVGKKYVYIDCDQTEAENNVPIPITLKVRDEGKNLYIAKGHTFIGTVAGTVDLKITWSQLKNFGIYYGMEEIRRHL